MSGGELPKVRVECGEYPDYLTVGEEHSERAYHWVYEPPVVACPVDGTVLRVKAAMPVGGTASVVWWMACPDCGWDRDYPHTDLLRSSYSEREIREQGAWRDEYDR